MRKCGFDQKGGEEQGREERDDKIGGERALVPERSKKEREMRREETALNLHSFACDFCPGHFVYSHLTSLRISNCNLEVSLP